MSNQNEQPFNVEIKGTEYSFLVTREHYNKYINATTQTNKVAPCHNFLMTTVVEKQRGALKQVLAENVGAEVQIASSILEDYTPDLGIVVKKSSSVQSV